MKNIIITIIGVVFITVMGIAYFGGESSYLGVQVKSLFDSIAGELPTINF